MKHLMRVGVVTVAILFTSSCAYLRYPGQPGVKTDGYSKLEYEYLDFDGLFVYEAAYDNTKGGAGVAALITKFYPGAQTYTSNVRYNADGTLYRAKGQYDGAEVQAIVLPALKQVLMPAKNNVWGFMSSYTSENEVDDRNLAEEGLFKSPSRSSSTGTFDRAKRYLQVLKAGTLNRTGGLSYFVTAVELEGKKLEFERALHVQTNLFQSALKSDVTEAEKRSMVAFIDSQFPTGFGGDIRIHLKDVSEPMVFPLAIHTLATAKTAGFQIIEKSQAELNEIAKRLGRS